MAQKYFENAKVSGGLVKSCDGSSTLYQYSMVINGNGNERNV